MGEEMIRKGLEFGSHRYGSNRFRVTVAAFNERALKVCRWIGFREVHRFRRPTDNEEFAVLVLDGNEWRTNRRSQSREAGASQGAWARVCAENQYE